MFTRGKGCLSYLWYGWGGWGRKDLTVPRHTGGLCWNWGCVWKHPSWHIIQPRRSQGAGSAFRWLRRLQILSCKNRPDNTCLKGIYPAVCAKYSAVIGQRILSKYSQRLDEILTSPSSSYCKKKQQKKKSCWFLGAEGSTSSCISAWNSQLWSMCLPLITTSTAVEEQRT